MLNKLRTSLLLLGAMLALHSGCNCSTTEQSNRPGLDDEINAAARFVPHRFRLDVLSTGKSTIAGRPTVTVVGEQQLTYSWLPRDEWLELQIHSLNANARANGRRAFSMELSADEASGHIDGGSIHRTLKCTTGQLSDLLKKTFDVPFFRMQANAAGEQLRRESLATPATHLLVQTGAVDLAQLLLAPASLTSNSWSRQAQIPAGNGVAFEGKLDFQVTDPDWSPETDKWFIGVKVNGKFAGDGKYLVRTATTLEGTEDDPKAEVNVSDSWGNLSGNLVYSLQTRQWISGNLVANIGAKITGQGETVRVESNHKITLQEALPLTPTPLPRFVSKWDLATLQQQAESAEEEFDVEHVCVGDSDAFEIAKKYPQGVNVSFLSPDGSRLFVLDTTGKLEAIRLPDFVVERKQQLGAQIKNLVLTSAGLVAFEAEPQRLLLLDADTLDISKSFSAEGLSSIGGSPARPWIAATNEDGNSLVIIDLEKSERLYNLRVRDLNRLGPLAKAPKTTPIDKIHLACITPNGEHLICASSNRLHRFAIEDGLLFYEEDSPALRPIGNKLFVSHDSTWAAVDVVDSRGSFGGSYWLPIDPFDRKRIDDSSSRDDALLAMKDDGNQLLKIDEEGKKVFFKWRADGPEPMYGSFEGFRKFFQKPQAVLLHPIETQVLVLGSEGCLRLDCEPESFPRTIKPLPFERTGEDANERFGMPTKETLRPNLSIPAKVVDRGLQWSRDGKYVYVLMENGVLWKISGSNQTVVRKVDLGGTCSGLTWSDGKLLVQRTSPLDFVKVDPDSLDAARRWPMVRSREISGSIHHPLVVASAERSKKLYVINSNTGHWERIEIERYRTEEHPHSMFMNHAFSQDGKLLYCNMLYSIQFLAIDDNFNAVKWLKSKTGADFDIGHDFFATIEWRTHSSRDREMTRLYHADDLEHPLVEMETPIFKAWPFVYDPVAKVFYYLKSQQLIPLGKPTSLPLGSTGISRRAAPIQKTMSPVQQILVIAVNGDEPTLVWIERANAN